MALSYRYCLALLGGSFALSLVGCQAKPTLRSSSPPPLPSQPLLPSVQSKPVPVAQPITFTVSVDTPAADLLIQPGSFIREGEVIANPITRRSALTSQKREIEAKLSSLNNSPAVNPGTQPEEENLALAQKRLEAAQASLQEYQRDSPWTDFARENLPLAKEEVQYTRLQNALQQAQLNVDQARATLREKKSAISTFQSDQSLAQQNLQKALAQITQQLTALQPLKSPHTGTITQMDLPKNPIAGQPVTVMVKLIPGDAPIPLKPKNDLSAGQPLVPPNGTAPELLPPGVPSGTASDLLPPEAPGGNASDLLPPGLPNPTQLPSSRDLPSQIPAPNATASPDSVVE